MRWPRNTIKALGFSAALAVSTAIAAAPAAVAGPYDQPPLNLVFEWRGAGAAANIHSSTLLELEDKQIVPGDTASRTLRVTNNGPTAGVLTARISNVQVINDHVADHEQSWDHITMSFAGAGAVGEGNFPINLVALGQPGVLPIGATTGTSFITHTVTLAQGASAELDFALNFQAFLDGRMTPGNSAVSNPHPAQIPFEVQFLVQLAISGELPEPGPTPPVTPTPTPPPLPPVPPVPPTAPPVPPLPPVPPVTPPPLTPQPPLPPDIILPPIGVWPPEVVTPPVIEPPYLGITPPLEVLVPPTETPNFGEPPTVAITGGNDEDGYDQSTKIPAPEVAITGDGSGDSGGDGTPILAETGGVVLLGQPAWLWGLAIVLVAGVIAFARKPAEH